MLVLYSMGYGAVGCKCLVLTTAIPRTTHEIAAVVPGGAQQRMQRSTASS